MNGNAIKSIRSFTCKACVIYLFSFVWACNPNQHYISEIEALETTVDSLQNVFTPINSDTIKHRIQKLSLLEDSLKKCMADSISILFYEANVAPTENLKKSMNRWGKSYLKGTNEFKYAKNQLKNLKEDVQHKLLEEATIIKYVETEKTAITQLKDYVEKTISWQKQALESYSVVYKDLELALDSCITRQNQQ